MASLSTVDDLDFLVKDDQQIAELLSKNAQLLSRFGSVQSRPNKASKRKRSKLPRWMKRGDTKATISRWHVANDPYNTRGKVLELVEEPVITPKIMQESSLWFDVPMTPKEAQILVTGPNGLYAEHLMFERTDSALELEEYATLTAVGIGKRRRKYVLLENEKKTGYHFPGGTVRPGESPQRALAREFPEECGVSCQIVQLITEFLVGEDALHTFSAYEVKVGDEYFRIPKYNHEEPIVNILLVSEPELEAACNNPSGILMVNGKPGKGILPNHRRAFLEYLKQKRTKSSRRNKLARKEG